MPLTLDGPEPVKFCKKKPLSRDMVLAATPKCSATALDCIPPCNIPIAVERCSDVHVSLERCPMIKNGSVLGGFE